MLAHRYFSRFSSMQLSLVKLLSLFRLRQIFCVGFKIMPKSSNKNDSLGRDTLTTMAANDKRILSATNPEIFVTSPRPGGFLKIIVPSKSQDFITADGPSEPDTELSAEQLFKKSRISTASSHGRTCAYCPDGSQSTLKGRTFGNDPGMDVDFDEMDELTNIINSEMENEGTVGMLAVTVSTVMLMASENPVPQEYLDWAETYLTNITDEKGQYPPNIRGILDCIKKMRGNDRFGDSRGNDGGNVDTGAGGCKGCNCIL